RVGYPLGFTRLRLCGVTNNLLTAALSSPQSLDLTGWVLCNDGVGSIQDGLSGPVVLLQPNHRSVRVVVFKVHDVADIGTSKSIDRLVGVAHNGELATFGCHTFRLTRSTGEEPHQTVLRVVRVLVLVHQDKPETTPVVIENRRERIKHVDHV